MRQRLRMLLKDLLQPVAQASRLSVVFVEAGEFRLVGNHLCAVIQQNQKGNQTVSPVNGADAAEADAHRAGNGTAEGNAMVGAGVRFRLPGKDDGGNSHAHRKNRKAEKQEGDNAEDQSGGVPMMMRFRGLLWKRGLLHETFLHSTSFQLPIS